jgi:hypothetical protein
MGATSRAHVGAVSVGAPANILTPAAQAASRTAAGIRLKPPCGRHRVTEGILTAESLGDESAATTI